MKRRHLAAVLLAIVLLTAPALSGVSVPTARATIFEDFANWIVSPFIEPFDEAPSTPSPTPRLLEGLLKDSVDLESTRVPILTPTPRIIAPLDKVDLNPPSIKDLFPDPTPKPTAKPTSKPAQPAPTKAPSQPAGPAGNPGQTSKGFKGAVLNPVGLPVLSLRPALTDQWIMLTPIDLADEGRQNYQLIANNRNEVGWVKTIIQDGTLTVQTEILDGVKVIDPFLTFFKDLNDIKTLDVRLLANKRFPLEQPIPIAQTFGEDQKVLLYLHITADYAANVKGMTEFIPENYASYMADLLDLLD